MRARTRKTRFWLPSHRFVCSHFIITGKFICYTHIKLRVLVVVHNFKMETKPPKHVQWDEMVFGSSSSSGLRGCLKIISFEYQKVYHISVMMMVMLVLYKIQLNGCNGWTPRSLSLSSCVYMWHDLTDNFWVMLNFWVCELYILDHNSTEKIRSPFV